MPDYRELHVGKEIINGIVYETVSVVLRGECLYTMGIDPRIVLTREDIVGGLIDMQDAYEVVGRSFFKNHEPFRWATPLPTGWTNHDLPVSMSKVIGE